MDAGDEAIITFQTGRIPRRPWRVVSRCPFGHPSAIASPSLLADGTRFPTWAWLTCPHVAEGAARAESSGELASWNARLASEPVLAAELALAEEALRAARAAEGAGEDACAGSGVAGQRVAGSAKCLHAHAALFLAGISDPIGEAIVHACGESCGSDRCGRSGDTREKP